MKTHQLLHVMAAVLAFGCAPCVGRDESAGAVVLINSASPRHADFDRYLKLYLDYFDVPYETSDVAGRTTPMDVGGAALVVLGHEGVLAGARPEDVAALDRYVREGGGLWSFDMAAGAKTGPGWLPGLLQFEQTEPAVIAPASPVKFVDRYHYITACKIDRPDLQTVEPAFRAGYPGTVTMPRVTAMSPQAKTLVTLADAPLVVLLPHGRGRIVQWTTYAWLDANILGFYHGLDDIVWRSWVWAARKPFVFQGNLPLVSMRLDDCYGPWDDFRYIEVINKHGITPHIAFFMDAMTPAAAARLGEYTRAGKAEAFVHSREEHDGRFFYSDFDVHDRVPGKPASDATIRRNFADLDAFVKKYGIKYARTAVPHWTAPGQNTLPLLRAMGIQFASFNGALPVVGENQTWPYQLHQAAGHYDRSFGTYGSGNFVYHPSVVLDYVAGDPSIFCVNAGCPSLKADWLRPSRAPGYEDTRKVAGMIVDGSTMLRHHLDSMGPAYFFTHELNIGMLEGRNDGLDRAFAGVFANLRKFYDVIPCGFDYLNQYNKNVRTIVFEAAAVDPRQRELRVHCNGYSDMVTKFHVFTENDGRITDSLHDVPVCRGATTVTVSLR